MISGYVTYTSPMQKSQHSTFVWIAEPQDVPAASAPIAFWSNGGPGCSGLFGMGFENGPFVAQEDGTLGYSPYAWNKKMVGLCRFPLCRQPARAPLPATSPPLPVPARADDGLV